jgi:hypothetical protein
MEHDDLLSYLNDSTAEGEPSHRKAPTEPPPVAEAPEEAEAEATEDGDDFWAQALAEDPPIVVDEPAPIATAKTEPPPATEEAEAPKRGPGRPKGSKGKRVLHPNVAPGIAVVSTEPGGGGGSGRTEADDSIDNSPDADEPIGYVPTDKAQPSGDMHIHVSANFPKDLRGEIHRTREVAFNTATGVAELGHVQAEILSATKENAEGLVQLAQAVGTLQSVLELAIKRQTLSAEDVDRIADSLFARMQVRAKRS